MIVSKIRYILGKSVFGKLDGKLNCQLEEIIKRCSQDELLTLITYCHMGNCKASHTLIHWLFFWKKYDLIKILFQRDDLDFELLMITPCEHLSNMVTPLMALFNKDDTDDDREKNIIIFDVVYSNIKNMDDIMKKTCSMFGKTILHRLAEKDENYYIFYYIILVGCISKEVLYDIFFGNYRRPIIIVTAMKESFKILEFILSLYSDNMDELLGLTDKFNRTVLYYLARTDRKYTDVLNTILEHCSNKVLLASYNHSDKYGVTPKDVCAEKYAFDDNGRYMKYDSILGKEIEKVESKSSC